MKSKAKPKEDKYCRECGSKLEEHYTKRYDPQTGERIKGKHCPNLVCREGCGYDGHKYMMFFDKCKRCGDVIQDY